MLDFYGKRTSFDTMIFPFSHYNYLHNKLKHYFGFYKITNLEATQIASELNSLLANLPPSINYVGVDRANGTNFHPAIQCTFSKNNELKSYLMNITSKPSNNNQLHLKAKNSFITKTAYHNRVETDKQSFITNLYQSSTNQNIIHMELKQLHRIILLKQLMHTKLLYEFNHNKNSYVIQHLAAPLLFNRDANMWGHASMDWFSKLDFIVHQTQLKYNLNYEDSFHLTIYVYLIHTPKLPIEFLYEYKNINNMSSILHILGKNPKSSVKEHTYWLHNNDACGDMFN